jgi:hypothetical protein
MVLVVGTQQHGSAANRGLEDQGNGSQKWVWPLKFGQVCRRLTLGLNQPKN